VQLTAWKEFVSKITDRMSSGTLNPAHSLTLYW